MESAISCDQYFRQLLIMPIGKPCSEISKIWPPARLNHVAIAVPDLEAASETYRSALGAEVSGTGDFTFDMNDLDTFDGIPAPTGALVMKIVGANGLIDVLIDMGLVASEEAMAARMMMGLFARPGEGEDTLTSKIEIDGATGAIMANGQRLQ